MLIMNKKQAALFLYLLEDLVFDRKFHLQQSVVFETKESLVTGMFYPGDAYFAPFTSPEDAYTFKETFVNRTLKSGISEYNKEQIQQDLQKDMPATFEKLKDFVLHYEEYEEVKDIKTIVTDDTVIKNVNFMNIPNKIFPFFIFPKDVTFNPVSLLFGS